MRLQKISIDDINIENAPQSKVRQKSLLEMSQVEPVTLRLLKSGRYEIVDGRRRIVDLIANGVKEVLAIVRDDLSDNDADLHALILNSGKSNEIDEASHIVRLISNGYSQSDIAKKTGWSQAKISKRIKLWNNLAPKLKALLQAGKMKYSAALAACALSEEEQNNLEVFDYASIKNLVKDKQSAMLSHLFNDVMFERYDRFEQRLIINSEQLEEARNGSVILRIGDEEFELRRL